MKNIIFGIFIGIFISYIFLKIFLNKQSKKPDATMVINRTNPEKDIFRLEMNIPFGELPNRSFIFVSIKNEDA